MALVLTTALTTASAAQHASAGGQGDFDWEIGSWRSSVRVLADPLSDTPDEWLRFSGTTVVKPLAEGRANVVELDVTGPAGTLEALNLRLYEPQADRWSLTFVNVRDGLLTPAVHGGFDGRVGTFYGDDVLGDRPIKVRFVVTRVSRDEARFEQAFSADGGATWETNWVVVDKRVRR